MVLVRHEYLDIYLPDLYNFCICLKRSYIRKRGSSVVRHLPLVLEVPGSIPAGGEKNFGVRTYFL